MSATATAAPVSIPAEPISHKDGLRDKHAHAGVAMAIATLAMAAASGIQALLYLSSFGIGDRTDGFFVAFALDSSFGVFSQSIRVTSAPLLVGRRPRLTSTECAVALTAISLPVAILTIPLAGPLTDLLAPGLSAAGRGVTESALPILGGARVRQLWAAGAATLLAVRDRFDRVASPYPAGAGPALLASPAVSGPAGELSLAWSMLAMAVVTCAAMLEGARSSAADAIPAIDRGLRRFGRAIGLVLGSTAIYLAFNGLYVVTLAFVGNYDAGDATVLSYAYLFASYLVAATGFALGMSRIADMRRGALADWREVIADTVPAGFRYAMMLVAPALAARNRGGRALLRRAALLRGLPAPCRRRPRERTDRPRARPRRPPLRPARRRQLRHRRRDRGRGRQRRRLAAADDRDRLAPLRPARHPFRGRPDAAAGRCGEAGLGMNVAVRPANQREGLSVRGLARRLAANADARALSLIGLFFALLAALSWRAWGVPSVDAGHELTVAAAITEGLQPYGDIRYFYGPVGVYSLAGAFALFGAGFTTAFAFGLVQAAAIVVAFYALARQLLSVVPALIATLIVAAIGFSGTPFNFVLPHTNSATFGLLFTLLMLLCLSRERLLAAGLTAGVVGLTRPELAALAAIALAGYLIGPWPQYGLG